MNHLFRRTFRRVATSVGLAAVLLLFLSCALSAAPGPVLIYQPTPTGPCSMYIPSTHSSIVLTGTDKMRNPVIADVDGNGIEDEIIYTDAAKGGIGYYRISGDGKWNAANDHYLSGTPADAIPLTVVRSGGVGFTGYIVYKSATFQQAYSVKPDGTFPTALGKMDKAFAADLRGRGYKSDLLWWLSGAGMSWREGLTGPNHKCPATNWVPVGAGSTMSAYPARKIVFYATGTMFAPTLSACDATFAAVAPVLSGFTGSFFASTGNLTVGDIDADGLCEIIYASSSASTLQWYNVPAAGTPWSLSNVVTEPSLVPGWTIRGTAMVDTSSVAPPPAPTPTPTPTPTPITVTDISSLSSLADGTSVALAAKSRTRLVRTRDASGNISATGFYVEETDKSCGVRVVGSTTALAGQQVAVTGILGTQGGERIITSTAQTLSSTVSQVPAVSTTISSLFGTVAMTGLLVQFAGAISTADIANGYLTMTDGTKSVKVYCPDNASASGQVTVTGCVGAEAGSTGTVPVVRVESNSDITVASTPAPTPPPAPTPAAGYSVWPRTNLEKVYKTDAAQTLKTAAITAAKNEHEAFQIVLRGGAAQVDSVTLTPGALKSTTGAIDASNVKLSMVQYINLPDFGVDYPDAVPPYTGAFTLAAGQTQPIWVDVFVPKTALSGDYAGSITVSDASGAQSTVPYTLHVYNFTLPDDYKCETSFGLWDDQIATQHAETMHSPAHVQTTKNYYEMMLSHGVSSYNIPYGVDFGSAEGQRYLNDPRMTSFILPYTTNASSMSSTAARLDAMGALRKAYFYTYDEPYQASLFDQIKQTCTYLHGCNPKIRTMVTFSDYPRQSTEPSWAAGQSYAVGDIVGHNASGFYSGLPYLFKCKAAHTSQAGTSEPWSGNNWQQYWTRATHADFLAGYIDIWCIGSGFYPQVKDAFAQRRALGETVWTYNWFGVARGGGITPPLDSRVQSWIGYKNDCQGMLWWCADFWQGLANPWTSMKNNGTVYGEGNLYYPGYQVGIDGGVPSIRMEMLRDGMEDYQYLWLLQQKSGRAAALNYVNQAVTDYTNYTKDITKFSSIRDQIAHAIEQ